MREKSDLFFTKENKQNSQQSKQFRGGVTKVMKKKLAAFVLSSSMVLSMTVPAFAAATDSTPGKQLQDLGIILGDQNGDLMEEANWDREDVAVLISRLLGVEEEAAATEKGHTYKDVKGTYYDGFLTWAKAEGLMEGNSATDFGFNDDITFKQFAAVVLRALGIDTTGANYANVPTLAVEAGIVPAGTNFDAVATRGQSYTVLVTALNTVIPGTNQTLGNKLGLPGFEVVNPAVASVEALNLKQVKVTFNKEVDKASAETAANYKVYNNGASTDLVGAGSVALQSDKKSVVVTLTTALNNGQTAKVVVENVKDTAAKAIAKYENENVVVSDTTVPTVVGVSVTGPRTISVEFSEPVKDAVANDFAVDGGNYIVTGVAVDNNKVSVTVGVDLTVGEHNVKVGGAGVADFAGYKPVTATKSFTFVKDETAPVATVKSVSPTQVKISFNKPVDNLTNANIAFRHTYNNSTYQVLGSDAAKVTVNAAKTEVTVDFTGAPIPLGSNNIYISYVSDSSTQIADLWGNKLAAVALPVSVTMDTVKPAVKEVKFESASALKVIFTEELDKVSAETSSNFTVKDSAGKVVSVASAVLGGTDKNEVALTFAADALGGGSYTIEVKGVKDKALVANIMDTYTSNLTVNDTVKPYVLASSYYADATAGAEKTTVYIPFSEQMNPATLVKGNFLKNIGGGYVALGADDTLTVAADGKAVTIVIKGHGAAVDVKVGAVTDLAGNGLTWLGATSGAADAGDSKADGIYALTADAVSVSKVEATGTKQIKVTFSGRLSTVTATGFALTGGAGYTNALSVASHTINSDNKSEVVFNLGTALTKDVKDGAANISLVATNASGTKSFLGTVLTNDSDVVADKLAPALASTGVSVDQVSATEIVLTFDEALNADTFAATLNGFSVAGGDAKLTAVAPGADATKVVLTGTGFVANGTTVSYNEVAGIADAAGNKLASFADKKAE